jgi:selenocysteine lyase/cysteine desulfurase
MKLIDGLEAPLFRRLVEGIASIDGVRIFGPGLDAARTPTLGFTVAGASPRAVAERLGETGLFVWDGDFYATTVIDRLGLRDSGGIVRVGMAPYNTPEEVDRLLAAVAAMRAGA